MQWLESHAMRHSMADTSRCTGAWYPYEKSVCDYDQPPRINLLKKAIKMNESTNKVATPFDWDVPTEGLRTARTLEEAFGPGAYLELPTRVITPTHVTYVLATILFVASAVLLVVPATKHPKPWDQPFSAAKVQTSSTNN